MLLQLSISGLAVGAIYALIALGFTLIWNAVGIVNFAQGDIVMVAAFLMTAWFTNHLNLPWIISVLLVIVSMVIFGVLVSRFLYHPLRKAPQISAIVATIGLSIFLENIAVVIWGPAPLAASSPLKSETLKLGHSVVSVQNIVILAILLLLMAIQIYTFRRTSIGTAMQAVSQDSEVAQLMGINTSLVIAITFAYSFVLAGVGGVLLGPLYFVSSTMGALASLKAFAACIIGGFGNVQGAVVGGLILGVVESFGSYYISTQYIDVLSFGLLILFLIFRPQGIFGEPAMERP